MMNAHGTYPFDGDRWRKVQNLFPYEAMKLAGVPEEEMALFPKQYPWINKGYIILGAPPSPANNLFLACMEQVTEGEVGMKNVAPGSQAVYIHDGSFMLIERKEPATCSKEE